MKFNLVCCFIVIVLLLSCTLKSTDKVTFELTSTTILLNSIKSKIKFTEGFDYPVGKPNGKGYYKAQDFLENNHLGEDWNGNDGGNTDKGDPVYAIANGYVSYSKDRKGGWGNVIRIIHFIDSNKQVESLYAHLNTLEVDSGVWIKKGYQIGTIGTANGKYMAHLHLEIRNVIGMPIGGGYSDYSEGYISPSDFIKANR